MILRTIEGNGVVLRDGNVFFLIFHSVFYPQLCYIKSSLAARAKNFVTCSNAIHILLIIILGFTEISILLRGKLTLFIIVLFSSFFIHREKMYVGPLQCEKTPKEFYTHLKMSCEINVHCT